MFALSAKPSSKKARRHLLAFEMLETRALAAADFAVEPQTLPSTFTAAISRAAAVEQSPSVAASTAASAMPFVPGEGAARREIISPQQVLALATSIHDGKENGSSHAKTPKESSEEQSSESTEKKPEQKSSRGSLKKPHLIATGGSGGGRTGPVSLVARDGTSGGSAGVFSFRFGFGPAMREPRPRLPAALSDRPSQTISVSGHWSKVATASWLERLSEASDSTLARKRFASLKARPRPDQDGVAQAIAESLAIQRMLRRQAAEIDQEESSETLLERGDPCQMASAACRAKSEERADVEAQASDEEGGPI